MTDEQAERLILAIEHAGDRIALTVATAILAGGAMEGRKWDECILKARWLLRDAMSTVEAGNL